MKLVLAIRIAMRLTVSMFTKLTKSGGHTYVNWSSPSATRMVAPGSAPSPR
jgi:hypothetical protein